MKILTLSHDLPLHVALWMIAAGLLFGARDVAAVDTTSVLTGTPAVAARSVSQASPSATAAQAVAIDPNEAHAAQFWGLSMDEVRRANVLLRGPRATFSMQNLSPVEALGIHARSEAERQRYAEHFARAVHADTERVLAWTVAFQAAMAKLYPNEAVIDYGAMAGKPGAAVSVGAADAANVPRSAVTLTPRPKAPVAPGARP